MNIENVAAPGIHPIPHMPAFAFDGYMLNPAQACHFDLAKAWTEADPFHSHTDPLFWLEQSDTTNSFLLEDAAGPVFFFRMDRDGTTVALHIQFPPEAPEARRRLMHGLSVGFTWLEKCLGRQGYKTVYFHSNSLGLIAFCCKRFGFAWDGKKMVREVR